MCQITLPINLSHNSTLMSKLLSRRHPSQVVNQFKRKDLKLGRFEKEKRTYRSINKNNQSRYKCNNLRRKRATWIPKSPIIKSTTILTKTNLTSLATLQNPQTTPKRILTPIISLDFTKKTKLHLINNFRTKRRVWVIVRWPGGKINISTKRALYRPP